MLAAAFRSLPIAVDTLVLMDERGLPLAWAGPSPRLPVHLRPLGGRAVAAEPGIGTVWVWWRESVFESGRPLGALLAGVRLPESGARSVLGVWAGRAALAAPVLDDSPGNPAPALPLRFEVHPVRPVVWSAPGLVLIAALAVLAFGRWEAVAAVLGGGLAAFILMGWLETGWWLGAAVAAAALVVSRLPRRWPLRVVGAVSLGLLGWALPGLFDALGIEPLPESLLWPGALRWVLVAAMAALVRGVGGRRSAVPLPLRIAVWIPLAIGMVRADATLLGIGTAAVAMWGLPGRGLVLPALVAAGLVVGGDDAARKVSLVATTEATLARLDRVEAPARAMLAQLPDEALTRMVRLEPGERLVVLGRLAAWMGLDRALPGTSLVLVDPAGEQAGCWGEIAIQGEGAPRELASRSLPNGWQVAILAPPAPSDLLAGLGAAGIEVPVAVVDRSGAPRSRGATFRPLSPAIVGKALAAGRLWADVGVGEREFPAYLRAHKDAVLVVPWVRPPVAEAGLLLAALTLWGVFPLTLWERRRSWLGWWAQRRTFGGRMRVLSVAAAVLPVLLLGQLLPRQWDRQQQKARLELARAISQLLATDRWEEGTSWLVRELGGAVAVYRSGTLVSSSRPDLAASGSIPWLPPPEAYVRSIRGWQEPLIVVEGDETSVFAPIRGGEGVVVGVVGLRLQAMGRTPSPGSGSSSPASSRCWSPSEPPSAWAGGWGAPSAGWSVRRTAWSGASRSRDLRPAATRTSRLWPRVHDDGTRGAAPGGRTPARARPARDRTRDALRGGDGRRQRERRRALQRRGGEAARRRTDDRRSRRALRARGFRNSGPNGGRRPGRGHRPPGRLARGALARDGAATPAGVGAGSGRHGGPLRGGARGAPVVTRGTRPHRRSRGEEPPHADRVVGRGAEDRARARPGGGDGGGAGGRAADPRAGGAPPRGGAEFPEPGSLERWS